MGVSQILGLSLSLILRSSATSVPLHVVERDAAHSQSAEPGEAAPRAILPQWLGAKWRRLLGHVSCGFLSLLLFL